MYKIVNGKQKELTNDEIAEIKASQLSDDQILKQAKEGKMAELKANKKTADLQDHHHQIGGTWYSFHMDTESRNVLSSILNSAVSIYGLSPSNPDHDSNVVYSSFGVDVWNYETKTKDGKTFIDLTYKELRGLFAHMSTRLGTIYALYAAKKTALETLTTIEEVRTFDTSIGYVAVG